MTGGVGCAHRLTILHKQLRTAPVVYRNGRGGLFEGKENGL